MSGADDRPQRALELAYRYLNRRDRTTAEVRKHLQAKQVDQPTVDWAINTLVDSGYLDDARYARLFTEDKRELEGWGSDRISRALLARGVDRDLIEVTLAGEACTSELRRAVALLRQRFPNPPEDRRERDRALGVLARKGYDSELSLDALTAYGRLAQEPGLR